MAKKKWNTVSVDDFFRRPEGPPSPLSLGNQKPSIARKAVERESNVKIPKPGPQVPKGTKPQTGSKTTRERLNNLGDLNPTNAPTASFDPVTFDLLPESEMLKIPKRGLEERLQEAKALGNRQEESRLLGLIRDLDELKKAKARPYNSPGVVEKIEQRINKFIAADPERKLTRGAIVDTLNLEVDPMYGKTLSGKSRVYADVANEYTAERIASGQTMLLKDYPIPEEVLNTLQNNSGLRPRTRAEKILAGQRRSLYEHSSVFEQEARLSGMGIPENSRVLFGNPPLMQGYGGIEAQSVQLDKIVTRQLGSTGNRNADALRRFNEIPLNFERNTNLLEGAGREGVQAAIHSEAPRLAVRASEGVAQEAGKITSRTAGIIAEDTMRAASVLHSSKLGGAAVGSMAIMGAFGIMSLKGSQSRRQKEVTGR